MFMVKAGPAVDAVIDQLVPLLEARRHPHRRRQTPTTPTPNAASPHCRRRGCNSSASESPAAREGRAQGPPASCPADRADAWPAVKPIFQAIAAKVRTEQRHPPAASGVGPGGSGHYVKMVHNGIEYGDMQLICEAYHLLKSSLNVTNEEFPPDLSPTGTRPKLDSLSDRDHPATSSRSRIPRRATSSWTASSTRPARRGPASGPASWRWTSGCRPRSSPRRCSPACLSAQKGRPRPRQQASCTAPDPATTSKIVAGLDRKSFIEDVRQALYASKICQLRAGLRATRRGRRRTQVGPELRQTSPCCGGAAASSAPRFLERIKEAFDRDPKLENLLLDSYFREAVEKAPALLAPSRRGGGPDRHPRAGVFPPRSTYYDGYRSAPPARQPAAGPARLLRFPHLPASRQAAGPVLPHRLDPRNESPELLATLRFSPGRSRFFPLSPQVVRPTSMR